MKIQFLQNLFKPTGATESPKSVDQSAPSAKMGVGEIRDSFEAQSSRNDDLLVAFEAGEARSPYVVGNLWSGSDKPPETDENSKRQNSQPQKKE